MAKMKKDGSPRSVRIPIGKKVGSASDASQLWSVGAATPNAGVSKTAAFTSTQAPSFFYSPELTSESWVLPKSRQEILKWELPLGSLVLCRGEVKKVEDIQVGDEVLSAQGRWQKVEKTVSHQYLANSEDGNELTEIRARGVLPFTMGSYHPIMALKFVKPETTKDSYDSYTYHHHTFRKGLVAELEKKATLTHIPQWVSPKLLGKGDYLVYPKYKEETLNTTFQIADKQYVLTEELANFFGWYMAEGHSSHAHGEITGTVEMHLHTDEYFIATMLQRVVKQVWDTEVHIHKRPDAKAYRVTFYSKDVAAFLVREFNHGASHKHIPQFILDASKPILAAFLKAYIQGDGTTRTQKGVVTRSVTTVSQELAHQLTLALSKLDILASINRLDMHARDYFCRGQKLNTQPYAYMLSIQGGMLRRLYPEIPDDGKKKVVKYLEDSHNFYLPLVSTTHIAKDHVGYDLQTPDHTYVASVLVHNCRIFFNLEAVIQSIIKMHAMYPFSKFDIVTSDPSVTEFYKEMAFNGKFNLYNFMLQASLSYRKFGEAIPFGNQVSFKGEDGKTYYKWDKFILLEPELVEIKQDVWGGSPQFELIPTEDMKKSAEKILRGDDPALDALRSQIPPAILAALQQGKNIPLDPDHVSLIADITDPSATRGTPQIQCCFKVLIYQDWIRLAQTAIAQRYHFPVEIWKIGDLQHDPPIIPTEAQLTQWRNLINQSIQNPPFSIVAPPIVNYEAVGVGGKLLPIAPEYEYILDQLFIGMGVSKSLLTGEGPCLDETSRIVTKDGPKFFFEITYKDEIATLNPETEELEYHRPTKIFKQLYSGKMIHFKNSKVDHMVSPEHECWVKTPTTGWGKVKAKDVAKASRMRMHMKWQGNEPPKKVSLGGKKLDVATYLEFLGCWLNHGWLRYNTKEKEYQVGLPSTARALEITKKLPIAGKWVVSSNTPVMTKDNSASWVVTDKKLAEELLFSCGDGFTAGIPEWVKNLKKEYLQLFLSKFSPVLDFCIVSSPRLADDLVEVALKCGMAPSVDRGEWGYRVNFEPGETFSLSQKSFKSEEPYLGVIWCVDVPNHLFIAERNGRYVVTGNSFSNVKTMALHRLMMEYKSIRDKFEEWMIHKFFRPIAEKNNFYCTENGRRKLILPQISWYKSLDIEEEQAEKDQYLKLHKDGYISTRTLFSKFPNLDFETERKHLEEEKGTVWDKAKGERIPEAFSPSGDLGGGGGAILDIPEPPEPPMPEEPQQGGEPGSTEVGEIPGPEMSSPTEPTPIAPEV